MESVKQAAWWYVAIGCIFSMSAVEHAKRSASIKSSVRDNPIVFPVLFVTVSMIGWAPVILWLLLDKVRK